MLVLLLSGFFMWLLSVVVVSSHCVDVPGQGEGGVGDDHLLHQLTTCIGGYGRQCLALLGDGGHDIPGHHVGTAGVGAVLGGGRTCGGSGGPAGGRA